MPVTPWEGSGREPLVHCFDEGVYNGAKMALKSAARQSGSKTGVLGSGLKTGEAVVSPKSWTDEVM